MLAIHDRTAVWMQNLATHVERIVRRNFSHCLQRQRTHTIRLAV